MVPLNDLKAQYKSIKAEIDAAVLQTLETSQFILGSEVAAFEEEFAAYSGGGAGIGVNSGTSALHLALLAAGVGPGDEVLTTPFTFVATVAAICYTGAMPVYADIDPVSFNLDPAKVETAITPRTKAIIPVHLYGQPADMDPVLAIARRHGLIVIEDAAQAHGAEYKGRRAGSLADMACFSFYPGKNLGAYGEGGMVVTKNPDFAHRIRMLRDWGQEKKYHHVLRGYNYRLEGIQGAILRVKLRYLEQWTDARAAVAERYSRALEGSALTLPSARPDVRHAWHTYVVRAGNRDQLSAGLTADGIQHGIYYPIPVHLMEAYRDERYQAGDFPQAERACREVLSLPIFPEMTEAQTAEAVRAACRHAVPVAA